MIDAVILISIPELTQNDFSKLLELVSNEKRDKIMQFKFVQDSQNCLLGDILARIEICRITGLSNKQLEFAHNDYGKPFLVNNPYMHISDKRSIRFVETAQRFASNGVKRCTDKIKKDFSCFFRSIQGDKPCVQFDLNTHPHRYCQQIIHTTL